VKKKYMSLSGHAKAIRISEQKQDGKHWSSGQKVHLPYTLEKVVDRLCDAICSLSSQVISGITGRDWIIKLFN